jgi:Uma2 family endonuclease
VGRISERGIEGAPTLVVEILSPSTREIDRDAKLRLYASYGVPWYWIVDPDSRVVEVYRLEAGSYTLSKRVAGDEPLSAEPFPDLALAPASLWA